jgi:hypothetical protein
VIPEFEPKTGHLPPGIHEASWDEIAALFGYTAHRRHLLEGLRKVLLALKEAGCRRVYIDGSFVTAKEHPADFDGCWEVQGVDVDVLSHRAPALLSFRERRKAQKEAYGGEMFLAHMPADPFGTRFVDFFQQDRDGNAKGIIAIDLRDLS